MSEDATFADLLRVLVEARGLSDLIGDTPLKAQELLMLEVDELLERAEAIMQALVDDETALAPPE